MMDSIKREFLCLGSYMGKGVDFESTLEERVVLDEQMSSLQKWRGINTIFSYIVPK